VQAHQRRIVGRRGDDHGAPHPVRPQGVAHEILHFAAALADQADHRDVGLGIASHHAEQHGLAHTGTGEKPDTLAAADGEQSVDRPYAHIERVANCPPHEGVQGLARQRHSIRALEFPEAVQGPSGAIQHSSQQFIAHGHRRHAVRGNDSRARHHPADIAGGHQEEFIARKSDHFRFDLLAFRGVHQAPAADGSLAAHGLERHADHPAQRPFDDEFRGMGHALARLNQRPGPLLGPRPLGRGGAHGVETIMNGTRCARRRFAAPCRAIRSKWRRAVFPGEHRCATWRW